MIAAAWTLRESRNLVVLHVGAATTRAAPYLGTYWRHPATSVSVAEEATVRIAVSKVRVEVEVEVAESGLAAALEAGDNDRAMAILVEDHGEHVYRYCRRMLGGDNDADDAAQTVFVQAFQGLRDLRRVRNVRAWLLGVARHRCLDRVRVARRAPQPANDDAIAAIVDRITADHGAHHDPRVTRALDGCLDGLDDRSREVLVLRFHDDLTFEQIAAGCRDSAGALRVRLVRALAKLRHCLEHKGVQP